MRGLTFLGGTLGLQRNRDGPPHPQFDDAGGVTHDNNVCWTDQGVPTNYAVTVKCGAGSSVVLNCGDIRIIYCDGVNAVTTN